MEVDVRIASVVLLLVFTTAFAQERCQFMVAIPRDPRPELPPIEADGLTWNQRPFISAEDREDVCMDAYHVVSATSGSQVIYMDEEIVEEVPIAKLNYEGTSIPYIGIFLSGQRPLLGPEIRKIDDEWVLYITQRQDYETPTMRLYAFNIHIDDEDVSLVAGVSLQIVNIDDNEPVIEVFDTCQVPELGEPNRLTDCLYEVYDADGEISTRFMTFRIDSDRGDEDIFYIKGENIENEWYRMNMLLGLNQSLNFEENVLHIFSVTAMDSKPNNRTVNLMVQVENVEHRPPRWVEIFAVQQFDEKTAVNFTVRAIDGDTGINKPIYYRLEKNEEDTFFSINTTEGGRDGAIFFVDPIDRDELEQDIFRLSIIAYKDVEELFTVANVVIIVNDINDQRPEPLHKEYTIDMLEETPMSLNFDKEFGFHDRDLGENAQYSVRLESEYPPGAHEAFYIAPLVGYQRQTFIMGTFNHSMLDYEVPEFQNIKIRVVVTDLNNTDFIGVAEVFINLINWNDEEPSFNNTSTVVSFNETEGQGFLVTTIEAFDRDIDDVVIHSLMGNAADYLTIDELTGEIRVSVDDAFDYHRQNELFVQIRADDTLSYPYHTTTTQLVIQLNDINNTPPTLRLPRVSPQVEENVPPGFVIEEDGITATDPDTTANLQFEINWESTYATKQGRDTPAQEYVGCVDILTIYPDENNRGMAIGRVVAREIRPGETIDYEEFEILYLSVRVRDLNTEIGDDFDELTFTVIIIDMNDNAPEWAEGTLSQTFRVRELAESNVVIGSLLATDIDGPLYNQVRYTIYPREDTPPDLVKIDFVSGQLEVDLHQEIDADTPARYNLYYTVVASDECSMENRTECPPDPEFFETPGNITIEVIDTNNKVPYAELDKFNATVEIYENATFYDEVVQMFAHDLDRDEVYHNITYQINLAANPRLASFFDIDQETGLIYVYYPNPNDVLDRDGDESTHRILITIRDNNLRQADGNQNQNETEVLVVLLDVNDNAPEMPSRDSLSWTVSEGEAEGYLLLPTIYAPDRDEPNTDNSRVAYGVNYLEPIDRELEIPDLFNMISFRNEQDEYRGQLQTAMDLKGYWGTYEINITAYDHGIPQQVSHAAYSLVIEPYNFHDPAFVFPSPGLTLRIDRDRAMVNNRLSLVNGDLLDMVTATDEDGLHAGTVTFSVAGDADAVEYFVMSNEGENTGNLLLRTPVVETLREFTVTILATDQGTVPFSRSTEETVNLVFVPTTADPEFSVNAAEVRILEKDGGLGFSEQLPLAVDSKNYRCTDDCHDIYYVIIDGNTNGHFTVDPRTNVLSLLSPLNREEHETHTLAIAASNSPTVPGSAQSALTVTVVVREADPRPVFTRSQYTAGISTSDSINRELLTVQATHTENAAVTYAIDHESMAADPTLDNVKETAFILHPTTGALTLNIQPTAAMEGMFEFLVNAIDDAGASDTAEVRIYLISRTNRVFFLFNNTVAMIEANRDFIAQTFTVGFNMTCNIDEILAATNTSGAALSDVTELRAHFVKDDEPVPTGTIDEMRSDIQLLQLIQNTLNQQLLVLHDVVTGESPTIGVQSAEYIVYALGGLSMVLAFICIMLSIVFAVRTRSLNRQLQALSITKYGSVDSGLNRAGLAAPGTNKHALEGSNPVWNEALKAPQFDALSNASADSDDSDLIGIEDMPQFAYDYFPTDEDRTSFGEAMPQSSRVADHSNNFGFNASPFSSEFQSQFKK